MILLGPGKYLEAVRLWQRHKTMIWEMGINQRDRTLAQICPSSWEMVCVHSDAKQGVILGENYK